MSESPSMFIESPAVVITAIVLALGWELWALWRARRATSPGARLLILVNAQFTAVMVAALGMALATPIPEPLSSADIVTLNSHGVPEELIQRILASGRQVERLDWGRLTPVMVLLLLLQLPRLGLPSALRQIGGGQARRAR